MQEELIERSLVLLSTGHTPLEVGKQEHVKGLNICVVEDGVVCIFPDLLECNKDLRLRL